MKMKKTLLLISILTTLLFTTIPAIAAEKGQMGQMMGDGMMSQDMMQRHQMMQDMMGIIKDVMGIIKDMSHMPSSDQKKKLSDMMDKMDNMMKMHDDMMKKGMMQ